VPVEAAAASPHSSLAPTAPRHRDVAEGVCRSGPSGRLWEALDRSPLACRSRVNVTPAIGRRGRPLRAQTRPMPYADVGVMLERSMVSWGDLEWIREAWRGRVVVKGVHTADDARRAMDAGADALVVSNHGGRQLDGVAATIRVLPEVVAAADGRVEVLLDGGVRRGSDVVKALCLGARAVLVGRAYAYGLGAAGEAGVASASALDRSLVDVPPEWLRRVEAPAR